MSTETETENSPTGTAPPAPPLAEADALTEEPPRRGLLRRGRTRKPADDPPMTDVEAAGLAARVSDDPVTLGADDLACSDCGQVVAGPLDPAAVTYAEPTSRMLPNGVVSTSRAGLVEEPMTTCPACLARRLLADDLTARLFPRGFTISGLHHDGDGARHLVRSTLAATALLNMPMPDPATMTAPVLALAVRHLSSLGATLAWSRRFAPVLEATSGTANPRSWSHIRESQRLVHRRAYAALMADRLDLSAPPVPLAPPPIGPADLGSPVSPSTPIAGACLMCGIGSTTRPALAVARDGGREAASRMLWTLRRPPAEMLGGRRSPGHLVGYLCPDCDAAVTEEGALGPSALERSLTAALGLSHRWRGDATLSNVFGWGAIATNAVRHGRPLPPANAVRWGHLGDLDAMRDRLDSGLRG